jgi:hypothetical protein
MKLKILLTAFISTSFFINISLAQNPLVKQWDYRFGGAVNDYYSDMKQTTDGGYILGGFSSSGISGDKSQPVWGISYDYWIIKTNASGIKQWDKDFGGTGDDYLNSIQQTMDGGYILGGSSTSDIGGDKSQDNHDSLGVSYDYWILKTDSLGVKQWEKSYGGNHYDFFSNVIQTTDGGYIIAGYSDSDSSGDKTQPNWDTSATGFDFWMVKTDSLGNKQWDRVIGGNSDDMYVFVEQTPDNGYILGGSSASGISGDKSQPAWSYNFDYWLVKLDSAGIKQWDNVYGGTDADVMNSLQQTSDGGYILGGRSNSGVTGNKTAAPWSTGTHDYWMVKTDSFGNKQWDKVFGGLQAEDDFYKISQTADGGYLLAGTSYSNIGGDKTENNLGNEQTWVVKTDSLGNKKWDKTLRTATPVDDEWGFAMQTQDGCFMMANYTSAGIGGDKTQPSQGFDDYWIIKFCDTTSTTTITQLSDYPNTFSIYPNPANEYVTINYHFQAGDEIRLTDVLGKLLFTTKISLPTLNFKLQTLNLSSGIYFLKAGNEVCKFVKE